MSSDNRALSGSIVMSRDVTTRSALSYGPYVSVVDSLVLSITAGGSTRTIGRHLGAPDNDVSIPVTLPAGVATTIVRVLSNSKPATILFSGQATTTIDRDGFSVNVPLAANSPVLLAFPDTAKSVTRNQEFNTQFTRVAVHNSGKDTLSWWVKTVDVTFADPALCFDAQGLPRCTVTPKIGIPRSVRAIRDDTLTIAIPINVGIGIVPQPFPPRLLTFVLASPEGELTVRWRYP